ncbi:cysteine-rich RLK (RECEPTOR-like protein kinase) 8, partial [Striga hermonthica]
DGRINKFKARLVVKGFKQKEGYDFFDTYSPVTRIASIRVLLSIAALHNLEIHQMDVKTEFLNGELEEEIYMEQPECFVAPGQEKKVCKLIKSLYGLKQAPKQWHLKFDDVMLSNGFKINECDKCVYVKNISNTYVIVLLKKFNAYEGPLSRTPLDLSINLEANKGQPVAQLEYSRIIGSLMYLTNCTRSDLAYPVNKLSRFTSNPSHEHWNALKRVLKYLKYTLGYGIKYSRYPAVLEGYCDASRISDSRDSHSTSGYVFCIGGG